MVLTQYDLQYSFFSFLSDKIFNVGKNLEVMMEIRPRSQEGVLLAVHSTANDFLVLQMFNGSVSGNRVQCHLFKFYDKLKIHTYFKIVKKRNRYGR